MQVLREPERHRRRAGVLRRHVLRAELHRQLQGREGEGEVRLRHLPRPMGHRRLRRPPAGGGGQVPDTVRRLRAWIPLDRDLRGGGDVRQERDRMLLPVAVGGGGGDADGAAGDGGGGVRLVLYTFSDDEARRRLPSLAAVINACI